MNARETYPKLRLLMTDDGYRFVSLPDFITEYSPTQMQIQELLSHNVLYLRDYDVIYAEMLPESRIQLLPDSRLNKSLLVFLLSLAGLSGVYTLISEYIHFGFVPFGALIITVVYTLPMVYIMQWVYVEVFIRGFLWIWGLIAGRRVE